MNEINVKAYQDLIKLQSEVQNVKRNKKGYGYTYADLGSILEYVKPILAKHNYCIMQMIGSAEIVTKKVYNKDVNILEELPEPLITITTQLIHESGWTFSDKMVLPPTPVKGANAAQAVGATITYAKRYAIAAMLGIASEDDTDGVISRQKQPIQTQKQVVEKPRCPVTIQEMFDRMAGSDEATTKEHLNKYKWTKQEVEEIQEILKNKFRKEN